MKKGELRDKVTWEDHTVSEGARFQTQRLYLEPPFVTTTPYGTLNRMVPALLFCVKCICHHSYFYVSEYKNKHKSSRVYRWPSAGQAKWAEISEVPIPFQPRNSIFI